MKSVERLLKLYKRRTSIVLNNYNLDKYSKQSLILKKLTMILELVKM